MKRIACAALALALVACAAPKQSRLASVPSTPLNDFNLMRVEIPPILREAKQHPYTAPSDQACAALFAQMRAFDAVLGPDLDAPVAAVDQDALERGGAMVGDAAVDALTGAVEGLVPFRGWVRKLSGADRHAKEVAASIAAGAVRRGFLKGLSVARGCAGYYEQSALPPAKLGPGPN